MVRERLPVADPLNDDALRRHGRGLAGAVRRPVRAAGRASTARWSPPPTPPRSATRSRSPARTWPGARSWTGAGGRSAPAPSSSAQVPVFGPAQRPHRRCRRRRAGLPLGAGSGWQTRSPNLLTYLGIAGALGRGRVAGCWPAGSSARPSAWSRSEIAGLVEHREAMLHGVKEGRGRSRPGAAGHPGQRQRPRSCSDLPYDCVGRSARRAALEGPLQRRPDRPAARAPTVVVLVGDRVLALNRADDAPTGASIGSVTTLRDRTELARCEHELGSARSRPPTRCARRPTSSPTSCTRSPAWSSSASTTRWCASSTRQPTAEPRWTTRSPHGSRTPRRGAARWPRPAWPPSAGSSCGSPTGPGWAASTADLSADLTTVVGNLVDNALDAVAQRGRRRRPALGRGRPATRTATTSWSWCRDSGPGVRGGAGAAGLRARLHHQGPGRRGEQRLRPGPDPAGLPAARRRGRRVHNEEGAVFTARLPRDRRGG